jgi:hypothetical protein
LTADRPGTIRWLPASLVVWITTLALTLDARQPARFAKPAPGCSSHADAGRLGAARIGVIDRSHLVSIGFGVVGPKRGNTGESSACRSAAREPAWLDVSGLRQLADEKAGDPPSTGVGRA